MWRLIAHEPARGEQRDFLLTRIRDLQPRDEIFVWPADFDARSHVDNRAGAFAGGETQEVRIALDDRTAAHARERA